MNDFVEEKYPSGKPSPMTGTQAQAELPKYRCHKVVHALKIRNVELIPGPGNGGGGAYITPCEAGYAPFNVSADFVTKHKPFAGGYYVVYDDGYRSFSPAEAFEAGYTRI
jgi:hypothetical protein